MVENFVIDTIIIIIITSPVFFIQYPVAVIWIITAKKHIVISLRITWNTLCN